MTTSQIRVKVETTDLFESEDTGLSAYLIRAAETGRDQEHHTTELRIYGMVGGPITLGHIAHVNALYDIMLAVNQSLTHAETAPVTTPSGDPMDRPENAGLVRALVRASLQIASVFSDFAESGTHSQQAAFSDLRNATYALINLAIKLPEDHQ